MSFAQEVYFWVLLGASVLLLYVNGLPWILDTALRVLYPPIGG